MLENIEKQAHIPIRTWSLTLSIIATLSFTLPLLSLFFINNIRVLMMKQNKYPAGNLDRKRGFSQKSQVLSQGCIQFPPVIQRKQKFRLGTFQGEPLADLFCSRSVSIRKLQSEFYLEPGCRHWTEWPARTSDIVLVCVI